MYLVLAARTVHSDIKTGKLAGRGQKVHAEVNCIVYGNVYCFTSQGHIHIGEQVLNSDDCVELKHSVNASYDESGPHQDASKCSRAEGSTLARAAKALGKTLKPLGK